MRANEFVKKYGLDEAKRLLQRADGCKRISVSGVYCFEYDELKRLIESHELVESKGGLTKAKEVLADNPVWCFGSKRYSSPLEKAIADVESCQ